METPKGFNDFTGKEAAKRSRVRRIIEETFQLYGFEPSETPIIEYEKFVQGENSDDEAVSTIFKLQDRGKRKLALRYELTFPLKRIMRNKKLPYKRYQIGAVFRDEPTSANRFRQFTQCDCDIVGSKTNDEAEIFSTIKNIGKKLGINLTIYINNRRLLNEILEKQNIKNKETVIREIDKLDKLSEKEVKANLKKYNAEKLIAIFKKPEKEFEKYKAYSEIKELKKACKNYNIKVTFLPSLARGLSYYNGTIFEAKTKDKKESVFGGGAFMFNNIQSFGYGCGLERLSSIAEIAPKPTNTIVISINQDKEAIKLIQQLREKGTSCTLSTAKISKALEYANSKGIKQAIFVGEKEVKAGKFKIRNMETGKESVLKI